MFNIIITALGGIVLILGLGSKRLEKSSLPPTLLALFIGILLGPAMSGFIDLHAFGDRALLLEKAARLTLGIGLISTALRIPKSYLRHNWREMILLVCLTMLFMWCISTALVYLFLNIPFWLAALIGAIVTPTDPIAATPIVTGTVADKNITKRIRHALSFESGANDGLSYLFIFLAFLLLTRSPKEALSYWLFHTLLWDVGIATVCGLVLGYSSAHLLQAAEKRKLVGEDWRLVYTAALAFVAVGLGRIINSDEVLLVFAAGMMFTQVVSAEDRDREEHGQEAINRFFSIPIFALIGIAIPWQGWMDLGWQGFSLAILIVFLRRPPVLLFLRPLLPSLKNTSDALFVGWFGPIAIAAMYYSAIMECRLKIALIWDITSLVICMSVLLHGITAAPLTRFYGHRSK